MENQMKSAESDKTVIEAALDKLGGVEGARQLLRDELTIIKKQEHLIHCEYDPYTPEGWKVTEHKNRGQFVWSPQEAKLHQPKYKSNRVRGYDLMKDLAGMPVANANVLDYLLAYRQIIPESWRGKDIYFLGTTYCHRLSDYVRFLHWEGNYWQWGCNWPSLDWNSNELEVFLID